MRKMGESERWGTGEGASGDGRKEAELKHVGRKDGDADRASSIETWRKKQKDVELRERGQVERQEKTQGAQGGAFACRRAARTGQASAG